MPAENKVYLNGVIHSIKGITEAGTKNIIEISFLLFVKRRTQKVMEGDSRVRSVRYDDILVRVKKPELVEYLQKHKAAVGDSMSVTGVLVSEIVEKSYFCHQCGEKAFYSGALSYVYPLSLCMTKMKDKTVEVIHLTPEDLKKGRNEIRQILEEKRKTEGTIILTKKLPSEADDGGADAAITIQPKVEDQDVISYLQTVEEGSNVIHVMGNLCGEPVFKDDAKSGKNCVYQIGINRKVFIQEDDPANYADFPMIHSLGKQAESDSLHLQKGSLVNIEGSLQQRDGYKIRKNCPICGAENLINSSAIEVVPYAVEYAAHCLDENGQDTDEDVNAEEDGTDTVIEPEDQIREAEMNNVPYPKRSSEQDESQTYQNGDEEDYDRSQYEENGYEDDGEDDGKDDGFFEGEVEDDDSF